MTDHDKRERIEALKLEISMIRDGRYNPSVHDPHREPRFFRDSITCLNVGLEEKKEPCSKCFLDQFVPPEHRDQEIACHYIPLNDRKETIALLEKTGDRDRLEAALLTWLYNTVARLEKELGQSQDSAQRAGPQSVPRPNVA